MTSSSYVPLKSSVNSPSPPLSFERVSEDSLRALEILDGPQIAPPSGYGLRFDV